MVTTTSRYLALLVLLSSNHLQSSYCAVPTAISVSPSANWYGNDGDWSAVTLRIGNPEQWVDVIPNTASSETWVVDVGGCNGNSLCTSSRGGVYNKTKSTTWQRLGFFELGADKELGNTAYAEYGLDSITLGSTGVTLPSAILGSVNDTGYTWLGYFGLGTVPGSFDGKAPLSALSALVEKQGAVTSHSYGYTAGAKYRQKGVPTSLTLGGYDAQRFVPHSISFQLNPSQQPYTSINSITVGSSASSSNWTTPTLLLSASDRISATIDSSTPFLWLPASVCESFAEALGLTYNTSLNVYTFDNNTGQHNVLSGAQLNFTFVLGDTSTSTQLVNITMPYDAFDLKLTYPAIPNTTYGSDAATKKYFPLRQATNEAQYRIGRVFLQEAYLITDYERNTFSVHQAVHPINPITNTTIVAVTRDGLTTFTGPPEVNKKMSAGVIAGIVIGAAVALIALLSGIFCLRHRKQKKKDAQEKSSPDSESQQIIDETTAKHGRPPLIHETTGSTSYATEVGADASHERYEMPAPLGPIEMESPMSTMLNSAYSAEGTENLSSYEYARRKLAEQHAAERYSGLLGTKTDNDASQVAHYRPSDLPGQDSLLISPLASSQGSVMSGQPSPMTPGFMPQDAAAPPSYQRINPANVVYVGRLPDNVRLPATIPKVIGRDGRTIQSEISDPSTASDQARLATAPVESQDSIVSGPNSNHHSDVSPLSTETGSAVAELARQTAAAHTVRDEDTQMRSLLSQRGDETRLVGDDIIHIPQPAERKFSFEADMYTEGGTK